MCEQLSLTGESAAIEIKPEHTITTTPAATVSAATASPQQSAPAKENQDYLLSLIAKDIYIFDMRCWSHGITKQEFFKRWNRGFESSIIREKPDDEWWNAHHFAGTARRVKENGTADPEVIWKAIETHKPRHLKELAESWKRDAEWEYKTANSSKTAEESERWLLYAQKSWEYRNQCLRELNLPEEPLPEKFSTAYPDPMFWGESEKPLIKSKKHAQSNDTKGDDKQ